ncbi:sulfotransferase domain-containing protein [Flagellimonas marinaquae]
MKTGTTFLQTRVFPYLRGVTYVHGMESFYKGRFFTFGDLAPLLISNEGLTGSWYKDREFGLNYFERFQYSIKNIKRYFNQPKLIVVFREPSSFIYSSYKQSLHERGTLWWDSFFPFETLSKDELAQFEFSRFVNVLLENFSKEELLLLDYEELKESPASFVDVIMRFCLTEEAYQANNQVKFPIHEKSNSAVSAEYEGLFILNNKLSNFTRERFGFSLKRQVGGYELSINTLGRMLLPKSKKQKKPDNLSSIKAYYQQDWEKTAMLIKDLRQ